MMRRKLLFLVNPISGTKKKHRLKELIVSRATAAGFPFVILPTRADGDYHSLRQQVISEQFTDVVVCGGDGTVSTITSFLLELDISIGIIPMGSGNGLALAAGIPASVHQALDIIFYGQASYIDGFRINELFSCMMCGIGSDAQVAHDFARQKKRGLNTYLRLSASRYFLLQPYSFSLEINDHRWDTEAFFITVANSNQFGNHVTIAPKACLNDGLLDIVIVHKMNKLLLPFALLSQIAGINTVREIGRYRSGKNIVYLQAPALLIHNKSGAPHHIDGEPQAPAERIAIRVQPKAFRLLQPFSETASRH